MILLYELTDPVDCLQTVLLLRQLMVWPKDIRVVVNGYLGVGLVIVCIESDKEGFSYPDLGFHVCLNVVQVEPVLIVLSLQEC